MPPPAGLGAPVEQTPIVYPDGSRNLAIVYRLAGKTSRKSGRRIVVFADLGGDVLFDTNDCYNLANAISLLDDWLRPRIAAMSTATTKPTSPSPHQEPTR